MKLFPGNPVIWSSVLVLFLCASQHAETEANNPDVCQDLEDPGQINLLNSSVRDHKVEQAKVNDNFRCLLYPTNILTCSWSFHTLHKDAQLFVHIRICNDTTAVPDQNLWSEERVGSWSLSLQGHEDLYVILHFNITLHHEWLVYSFTYDTDMLEVLSPPQNISASIKDGGLLVTWALPHSPTDSNHECFEYQLDMGDQERAKNFTNQLSYTEPNADPSRTYRVRMRTRKMDVCQEFSQWSEWTQPVTVEKSNKLNMLAIISISLGIPMILLAVLLLLRHQRVSMVLFPPIPRPPQKYKCYLEKNDVFNPFHAAPSAEPVEEITEVQDTEQKTGNTL